MNNNDYSSSPSLPHRAEKARRQRQVLLVMCGIAALIVIVLVAMIIGAVADSSGSGGSKGETISQNKIKWDEDTVDDDDTLKGSLVLIDGDHEYMFPRQSLASISEFIEDEYDGEAPYKISGSSDLMAKEALEALDKLLSAFAEENDGKVLLVHWAYRSEAQQEAIYNGGSTSTAPGYSDHHSGYGCSIYREDRDELKTSDYNWLVEHAAEYGFIVRYPEDKEDITGEEDYAEYFRYVGVAHATYMYENELCLEEYLEFLADEVSADRPLTVNGADGGKYDIYYYPVDGETDIQVPVNCEYEISGTNDGGVVVTVIRTTIENVDDDKYADEDEDTDEDEEDTKRSTR